MLDKARLGEYRLLCICAESVSALDAGELRYVQGQLEHLEIDDLENLNNALKDSQERVQQALQKARKMRLLVGDDRSGGLALKILQSFLQARIDGLGKEAKFAIEDLIELTVDAARARKTIQQIKVVGREADVLSKKMQCYIHTYILSLRLSMILYQRECETGGCVRRGVLDGREEEAYARPGKKERL